MDTVEVHLKYQMRLVTSVARNDISRGTIDSMEMVPVGIYPIIQHNRFHNGSPRSMVYQIIKTRKQTP